MLLRRFSVQGYKNLQQPIVLDDLGPINVIHGPNNVGKSNLLQAIDLLFRCLLKRGKEGELPADRLLFHLERPAPIVLGAIVDVRPEEFAAAGLPPSLAAATIDVEVRLQWTAP